MRLHLLSDLHLDTDWVAAAEFLDGFKADGADLVVVAGDAFCKHIPSRLAELFLRLEELYPQILFVPGNHDYWGVTPEQALEGFQEAAARSGRIHIAHEPSVFEIDSQSFLCGTMWYPKPGPRKMQDFIDYERVRAPRSWMHEQFQAFKDLLQEKGDANTIVVTHHLPTPHSTPPKFATSPWDHFFMTNMTQDILEIKPKLWLHGHTHDGCDYDIAKTRVVCNPRGYPFEYQIRRPYEPALIEV